MLIGFALVLIEVAILVGGIGLLFNTGYMSPVTFAALLLFIALLEFGKELAWQRMRRSSDARLNVASSCNLYRVYRYWGRQGVADLLGEEEKERSLRPFIRTDSLFVHVPKAAGVSIARSLYGNLGMGHLALSDYQALFLGRTFNGMFKFAFVRNPFDRLHSAYHFLRAGGMSDEDAAIGARLAPSFERFVLEDLGKPDIMAYWHFLPQAHFINGHLDFIGRFENIEEDFAYVRKRVNPKATLPHLNRTEKADYRNAYTPKMTDAASAFYAKDLETFGYGFESGPKCDVINVEVLASDA